MEGPTQPDRQALIDFLWDLEAELTVLAGFLSDNLPREALPDFEGGLPGLRANVDLAIAQLQREAIAGQLAAADMLGVPLEMKLSVRNTARRLAGAVHEGWAVVVDAAKISLNAANVLLGSLLHLPGVEGIKEFKEGAEVGLGIVQYLSRGE